LYCRQFQQPLLVPLEWKPVLLTLMQPTLLMCQRRLLL
jgi:hypothetical protein